MPRDKNPRERQKRELRRRKAIRRPYDRILVVTEGSRTEPQYFEEIRVSVRATSAFVRILHSADGTDPLQIVEFAEKQFLETKAFEAIHAVFDRDAHGGYFAALTKAAALNGKHRNDEGKPVPFHAVPSVPNFELWILLHYQDLWSYTDRNDILTALRVHFRSYQKGDSGLYERLHERLPQANERAARLRSRHGPDSGVDPYTDVDLLIDRILRLREAVQTTT